MSEPCQPVCARVFNRRRLRLRRNRAASSFEPYAFLKNRIAGDLAERLALVNRRFARVLDLGAHSGQVGQAIRGQLTPEAWRIHADMCPAFAAQAPEGVASIVADEEALPFARSSFDLIVSGMSLHWVNDLPDALSRIRQMLVPDGLFLGAVVGGASLRELRTCLLDAEMEMTGGAAQRVSPFIDALNMADLLQRAGFAMPVVDAETIEVYYNSPKDLLRDLQGMGETAASARTGPALTRSLLDKALKVYAERYSDAGGRVRARFEIITAIGWSPGPGQPQAGLPGFARPDQRSGPGGLAGHGR